MPANFYSNLMQITCYMKRNYRSILSVSSTSYMCSAQLRTCSTKVNLFSQTRCIKQAY